MKADTSGVIACNYGCYECDDIGGESMNGSAVASQHAEAEGHHTWAEQVMSMEFNVKEGTKPTAGERVDD